jgi:hypothetical protein
MMDKRQQLKQKKQEELEGTDQAEVCEQLHMASPSPALLPGCTFITKRKAAGSSRPLGSPVQQQQHQQPIVSDSEEDTTDDDEALGTAAAGQAVGGSMVTVKREPEDWQCAAEGDEELLQHRVSAGCRADALDPAEAILQDMRVKQQQQQRRSPAKPQKQQQAVSIKQERLDPAEQLLQDMRQRQQQRQQQHVSGLEGTAAAAEEEGIDADSSSRGQQQQQQRRQQGRYSSANSFATEMSTASAKVPLRFVGAGQELDGSSAAVGGVSPLERLLQVALAGKAGADSRAAGTAADAESEGASGGMPREQGAAAAAGCGSVVVKQEDAVDWMHTPEEQQQRAVRRHAGQPGEGRGLVHVLPGVLGRYCVLAAVAAA